MKKVLDFVQRFDLLPRYELLLAAASGGMDSMCLLDFLYENGYRVCAAHYNHQLRGQEADMDEDLVRAWCAARRIPLCVGTGDVAAYAGENGLTIEEAARKLRYDFLNSVAGQTGAARIVTAHHANDNAETVLFHLARGTGMAGLAGIAPKNGRLVRPFLCLTREELAAYAKEHHVPYRTDATNADTALTRNFIRAEVVPKLCRVNAQAVEHIGETALRLRQEDEYLDTLAAAYLTELKTETGAVTLPCAAVAQAHAVLRPRVLRLALDALGAGKKDFTAAHYDALAALCAGSGTAQLDLPASDVEQLGEMFHVVNDLERIGDHAENMAEYANSRIEEEIPFSEDGLAELRDMLDKTVALFKLSMEAFHTRDQHLLPRVLVQEENIDDMEKTLQQSHVDRLTRGACTPRSGMIFSDMLSNLERVADHATNVAFSIQADQTVT